MATQPRMSAPIGRVRIKSTGRRPGSGDRWRAAEPAVEAEATEKTGSDLRTQFGVPVEGSFRST